MVGASGRRKIWEVHLKSPNAFQERLMTNIKMKHKNKFSIDISSLASLANRHKLPFTNQFVRPLPVVTVSFLSADRSSEHLLLAK